MISGSVAAANWWRGVAGDEYTERNALTKVALQGRIDLWASILQQLAEPPKVIAEVGAGAGHNLLALGLLLRKARMIAVEPNESAREALLRAELVQPGDLHDGVATALPLKGGDADLVFTSGVLIHVPPEDLKAACEEIKRVSRRYVISIEYFAAEPEEVSYRGEAGLLWKRDFGKFWLEEVGGVKPIACGFSWKEMTGLDNLTFWIFEKW